MRGMDARTGRALDGLEHIRQSIADVLGTPIGTRVMRRDYGSMLPELIDEAMNPVGRQRVIAASALAIARWVPRVRISRLQLLPTADPDAGPGAWELELEGDRTDVPAPNSRFRLAVPLGIGRLVPA